MKKLRIPEAYNAFILELIVKGRKSETITYYKSFLEPFFDTVKIKYTTQLNYDLVQNYIVSLRRQYSNPISINTNLRAVRAFCYFCARKNYCVPFKVNLVSATSPIKTPYDAATVRELIVNCEISKAGISILFLLATGVRAKTLCNIRVSDLDFKQNTVVLRQLKNNSQAVLPLPDYVSGKLQEYIRLFVIPPDAYLFTTIRGNPYSPRVLYELINRYLERKGFHAMGVHRFRHTFAKMAAEEGISSLLLSRWLTHSDIRQSEHYVNLYGPELKRSMQYNPIETILQKEKDSQ